jgi:hypothetical protein
MKIAKVLVDTKVYFKGNSQVIPAGTTYPEDALIVKENKELFVFETPAEVVKEEPKKQSKRKGKKKEEPKEELLIEEPVSVLEVTEVTEVEETTEQK